LLCNEGSSGTFLAMHYEDLHALAAAAIAMAAAAYLNSTKETVVMQC
jgi:hypothetical protein